ncbi:MAG: PqqD family protein [Planctomycetota bacterium]
MNIKLNDSVERINNYPFQKIEDETIIVDPKNRLMHQLNDVGSRLWELLIKERSVQEIADIIVEEYDIDAPTAQKDIIQILETLSEQKLIRIIHK